MTSFLRPLAYRYRWIYDTVTAVSSLSVGGVDKLRRLGLEALAPISTAAPLCSICAAAAAKRQHLGLPLVSG